MAIITLNNGTSVGMPAAKAEQIYLVLTGEIEGTEEQQRFCERVKSVTLNWRNPSTPASYLQEHKAALVSMARLNSVRLPELTSPGVDRLTLASQGDK